MLLRLSDGQHIDMLWGLSFDQISVGAIFACLADTVMVVVHVVRFDVNGSVRLRGVYGFDVWGGSVGSRARVRSRKTTKWSVCVEKRARVRRPITGGALTEILSRGRPRGGGDRYGRPL